MFIFSDLTISTALITYYKHALLATRLHFFCPDGLGDFYVRHKARQKRPQFTTLSIKNASTLSRIETRNANQGLIRIPLDVKQSLLDGRAAAVCPAIVLGAFQIRRGAPEAVHGGSQRVQKLARSKIIRAIGLPARLTVPARLKRPGQIGLPVGQASTGGIALG